MIIIYTCEGHDLFRAQHDEIPRKGDQMQHAACVYYVRAVTWLEDGDPSPAVEIELTRC